MSLCWRASIYNDLFCQFVYSKGHHNFVAASFVLPFDSQVTFFIYIIIRMFRGPSLLLTHRISPAGPRLLSLPLFLCTALTCGW